MMTSRTRSLVAFEQPLSEQGGLRHKTAECWISNDRSRLMEHGGGGVSQEFSLAYAYGSQRTLRLADGPDEVHLESIAKTELRKND